MGVFDSKVFNGDVFLKYMETIPRIKQNALLSSGVLRVRNDLKAKLVDSAGGNYITEPMIGRIGGAVQNYDGNTNITTTGIDTYSRGMIVFGRAKAWREYDFAADITGHDFMEDIARQVSDYWDDVDETDLLSVLSGIFGVTTSGFSTEHTLDLTTETVAADKVVGPATLNNAVQKAAGASKNNYTLAIMHSQVATNLENLELLTYRTQTDASGIQRKINLADWAGRTVLIDDDLVDTTGSDPVYTTYILGRNAIDFCDCGAKVPYEPNRDPKTNGGVDELITRQRHLLAPMGFSFTNTSILSPTETQLATAANWDLASNGETTPSYFPIKAIPIARIKSLG